MSNAAAGAAVDEAQEEGQVDMPEPELVDESSDDEEHGAERPVTRRDPTAPTRQEYEEHQRCHIPYRNWCPPCVLGRGKQNPHKKGDEGEGKGIPGFHIDYWFMRDKQGSELIPVATIVEEGTKAHKAHIVPGKGNVEGAVEMLVADIEAIGAKGPIVLKCDQEPALMDLCKSVKKRRTEATHLETARTHDSQSNGRAERAVQSVEGMTRTLKIALEARIGKEIPCEHPVMTWIVEHAAETINRYNVGPDGKTPYERMKGKKYRGEVTEFGRKVFYRFPGKAQGGSMQRRWGEGVWLGKRVGSDEHIISCSTGPIVKAGSITMKPKEESWSADAVLQVKGVPWALSGEKTTSGEKEIHPETQGAGGVAVEMGRTEGAAKMEEPDVPDVVPRDMMILPEYLAKYGHTDERKHGFRCPKCIGMQQNDRSFIRRSHTQACRDRIRKCLMEDELYQDRVQEQAKRKDEYVARQVERQVEREEGGKRARIVETQVEERGTMPGSSTDGTIGKPERAAGKRSRDAAGDVEEQERPIAFRAQDEDDGDDDADMGNVNVLNIAGEKRKSGWKRSEADEDEEECRMRRMSIAADRKSRGKYDVAEIFSPPRVSLQARKRGMAGGWSLDWMHVDPISGMKWDLRQPHTQKKVVDMIRRDKPRVIVACPPCTLFSQLQWLSGDPKERAPEKWAEAVAMVEFAVQVCELQLAEGRGFVFEHPLTATSWSLPCLKRLRQRAGVLQAVTHMCAFGMESSDAHGNGLAMKPTRFLTSSQAIFDKLNVKCSRDHRHVHLISGRAAGAAEYPRALVDAILDGIDIEEQGRIYNLMTAMDVLNVEGLHERDYDDWGAFVDDLTGEVLKTKDVVEARKCELKTFKDMKVYEYVARAVAEGSRTGKIVGVRWLDTWKNGKVKSRLVAQEYASKDEREDLFAATPPLAATKMLLSDIASKSHNGPGDCRVMVLDIKRAFLYGEIQEEIYIELPQEDEHKAEGYVGVLKKAMYGTRSAPQVWQSVVRKQMIHLGFEPSRVSPCVYTNKKRGLKVVTHVDDFMITGRVSELQWFRKALEKEFELTYEVLGDGYGEQKKVKFLGRELTWARGGIRYEGDPKHVAILLKEWNMDSSKPVGTPGTAAEKKKDDEDGIDKELNKEMATKYRRAAARINYMSLDRPDLGFAAKEISRGMAKPVEGDLIRLKRILRYLKGKPRMGIYYAWQEPIDKLTVFTDSDWAGCARTRRSTSGGLILLGGHLLTHWSSTQATVALSSGEAELNGVIKACSEALGMMNLYADVGEPKDGEVKTDSSAAHGIAHRLGSGRVKHLEARQLWVQEVIQNRALRLTKIPRKFNHADALTHHYLEHEGAVHFPAVGVEPIAVELGTVLVAASVNPHPTSMPKASSPRGGVRYHPVVTRYV